MALKRAQHEVRLALNAHLAELGTNISQVNVLREVMLNPGVSSTELAALAFLTPQSLGQLVVQLQERGLVRRVPGEARKLRHHITKKGDRLCQAAMEIVRELDATVMEGLSDEELTGLLETFEMFERRAASARARKTRSGSSS